MYFVHTKLGDTMFYYFNNFLLFAILGFCSENILHLIFHGSFTSNPFYGPWMPIYGFGVVIMIFLTRTIFNNLKAKRWIKIVLLFFSAAIILTLLELAGGTLAEFLFHKSFWDYSSMRFSIGKYISLEMSVVWGLSCLIFLYIIKPISDKILVRIPEFVTIVLLVLVVVDAIVSFPLK